MDCSCLSEQIVESEGIVSKSMSLPVEADQVLRLLHQLANLVKASNQSDYVNTELISLIWQIEDIAEMGRVEL